MNIEIANRLVNLRKVNNLSQEALAEKLGISRQAVSKWERAEASPDTDNLILLARLYGVSLDELLFTDEDIIIPEEEKEPAAEQTIYDTAEGSEDEERKEYVHIGLDGIHVKDRKGSEVHVGWHGIHVDDTGSHDNVHIDKNGVYVNGERYDKKWHYQYQFPVFLVTMIVYIIIGVMFNAWHPAWMLFLLIPLWDSFVNAVKHKNAHIFAYPVLATLVFLCAGFFMNAWHPAWVVFLTIPLYYSLVRYYKHRKKEMTIESTGREVENDEVWERESEDE